MNEYYCVEVRNVTSSQAIVRMRSHVACRTPSKMNAGKKGSFVVVSSLLAVVLLLVYIGKRDCRKVAVVARGVHTAKVAPDEGNAQAGRVAWKLQSCKLDTI